MLARARDLRRGYPPAVGGPPILIEVVDQEDRIRAVLPKLDAMVGDGPITLEKVEVLANRATGPKTAG